MSQKFGIRCKGMGIVGVAMLLWLGLAGCDPCRQLAEKICSCKESEEERRDCEKSLGLAPEHKYFKNAQEPEKCEQALKDCPTCEDIRNNKDDRCGLYRP